jgi:hypothetical protein
MTDRQFEARLAAVLRADAERAVRRFDAVAIASAAQAREPVALRGWVPRPGWQSTRAVLSVALLLLAVLALVWALAVGTSNRLLVVQASPSLAPTEAPPSATATDLARRVSGSWIADKPLDLSFGDPSGPARMTLVLDANGTSVFVKVSSSPAERLPSGSELIGPDQLRVTARAGASAGGGDPTQPCDVGAAGTYRLDLSDDGLFLTVVRMDEACPERAAVLERTWVRTLGEPSTGGRGVLDGFDPLVTVALPPGSYTVERAVDALTVVQIVPELQFMTIKDPQGFLDPCNLAAGRREIAPGADAFVAYFRQLAGFTVDSVSELQVDGRRAVRLVDHANADASCPDGRLWEWQPKAEPERSWFLRPGVIDSLIVVEYSSSTTLLFEVIPAPNNLEDDIIGSLRFLETLPAP